MVVYVIGSEYLAIAFKLSLLATLPRWDHYVLGIESSLWRTHTSRVWASVCAIKTVRGWLLTIQYVPLECLNRLQHHWDKLNMSISSALPDSWSSNIGRWPVHCTTQRACVHTERNLVSPQWKLYIALKTLPWGFAKIQKGDWQWCNTCFHWGHRWHHVFKAMERHPFESKR